MTTKELVNRLDLKVTPEQMAAIEKLEERGFTFCGHYGYENAVELLEQMDRAFRGGYLEEWLKGKGWD